MKRTKVRIKETDTEFVTGVVFRPTWSDTKIALGRIHEMGLEQDLMPHGTSVRVCVRYRGTANKVIPDILARAEFRKIHEKAPMAVQAILWVLACYHYTYSGGPYPGTIEKTPRTRRRKPIKKFQCPYCGHEWEPPKNYKYRHAILRAYGEWIANHKQCHNGEYIELAPEVE